MRLLLSVLVLAGLTVAGAFQTPAIQMEVKGGEKRCLSDSVRKGEDTVFSYKSIANSTGGVRSKVKVTISYPKGKEHHTNLTDESQEFAIPKESGGGGCTVCFENHGGKGTSTRVELAEINVPSEKGPRPKIAQHLRPVELLLHHAKEVSKSLKKQLSEGADLEFERISNEEVLRSNIKKVAAFTILVLLSVSGWQLALLNKFFRSKKLI